MSKANSYLHPKCIQVEKILAPQQQQRSRISLLLTRNYIKLRRGSGPSGSGQKKGCLIGGGFRGNYKKRHLFIYHCHFELREWALLSLPHIFRCGATCLDGNIASRCCCCWQSSTFSFPLPRWKGWHRVGWKSYCVVFFFDKINKV